MSDIDWSRHGTDPSAKPQGAGPRRLAVPVSEQLQKLIVIFKESYPDKKFSDTDVLKTFIESGAKTWYTQVKQTEGTQNDPS